MFRLVTGCFGRLAHLIKNNEAPQKSLNFNFILEKSLFNKKVVFLHKNNSFFGFGALKLILVGVLAQKPHFLVIFARSDLALYRPVTDILILRASIRA